MYGLTTVAMLHVALFSTAGSEYQNAYNRAEAAGMPLLVLVSTEDGANCRTMRNTTLPEMKQSGQLEDVIFVKVDADENPDLTSQILRTDSIPQLVLYTQVGQLWRRTHMTGAPSSVAIRAYLDREIARGREVAEQARQGVRTTSSGTTPTTQWSNPANLIHSYTSGSS